MRVLFGIASHASVSQRKQWQGITGRSTVFTSFIVQLRRYAARVFHAASANP
jgi:hypothetical protein